MFIQFFYDIIIFFKIFVFYEIWLRIFFYEFYIQENVAAWCPGSYLLRYFFIAVAELVSYQFIKMFKI